MQVSSIQHTTAAQQQEMATQEIASNVDSTAVKARSTAVSVGRVTEEAVSAGRAARHAA